jgi:ABC-type glycerol-3-phosphate transport system substrate-binding protein
MTEPSSTRRPPARWHVVFPIVLVGVTAAAAVVAPWLGRPTLRVAIHQGVEGVALKTVARAFSEEYNASVEVFELPYGALYDAEMRELASSGEPAFDVMMVDDPWLPALIGEDDLAGESTRVERLAFTPAECAALDPGDFVPSTLQVSLHPLDPKAPGRHDPAAPLKFSCDGRGDAFHALPFVGNSQLFVTRGELEPTTWVQVMDEFRKRPGAGYVTRVGAGNSIVTDFLPILWTLSRPSPDARQTSVPHVRVGEDPFALEDEPARQAFAFMQELGRNPRASRGVVSVDDFDVTINLVQGNASMSIAWSAWVMAVAMLPDHYSDRLLRGSPRRRPELHVTQVPGEEPVLGVWLLAIPARSAESTLAREFVLFATRHDQIQAAAFRGNPPPRVSVLNSPDLLQRFPFFPEQLASLSGARARPRTPHWREIEDVLGDCLTALYENAITSADDAWRRVKDGLEPILDKQRRIENLLATPVEAGAVTRTKIRAILDEPATAFSCQSQAGDAGRSND